MKNVNKVAKKIHYSTKEVKRIAEKTQLISELDTSLPKEVYDAVVEIVEAREYMAKNEKKYISERLRTAYIGEDCFTADGTQYIAMNRGKPTGTLVAILDEETDEIKIGVSLISKDEKYATPIVGLKKAMEKIDSPVIFGLDGHERKQLERFKLRAKAYFMPETFSFSRGTDPVSYPNYEKIHARQLMIKGEPAPKKKPAKAKKSTKKAEK